MAKYPSWEPEYAKKWQKEYRARNKEALAKKQREYYLSNLEEERAKRRAYYQSHREEGIKRANDWRKKNHEHAKEMKRKRYRTAHDHYIGKSRQYSSTRKVTGKSAAYRERVRTRQREWSLNRSAICTDGYAREMLSKYSPVSAPDWPQDLVEAKKLEIKIKREIRNEKRQRIA